MLEAEPASCHPELYFLHSPQGKDRTTEAFSARASSLADKQDEQDIGDDVTAGQLVDPACLHLLLSPILSLQHSHSLASTSTHSFSFSFTVTLTLFHCLLFRLKSFKICRL